MSVVLQPFFDALHGAWSLRRAIWHDGADKPLTVTGRADFHASASASDYAYHETGELMTDTGALPVQRRYAFAYDAAQDVIIVRHWQAGPGAPLHTLQCDAQHVARHRHVCGDDVYDVTYDFGGLLGASPAFVCDYRVRGPHKNYRMRSTFTRAA